MHYNSPVFSASETVNMFCSLAIFLRWKNAVFVTWEIWFSKEMLLSNITPRFLTVEVTVHLSSCKLWSKRICVLFFGPISNISVLSEFNRIKWLVIQSFTFLTHSVSLDNLEVQSGLVCIYIYAFRRHFYPKRLKVHSGYTFIVSMCVFLCRLI